MNILHIENQCFVAELKMRFVYKTNKRQSFGILFYADGFNLPIIRVIGFMHYSE